MTRELLLRALAEPSGPTTDYDLNPDVVLPANRKLRPAAVLIGVREGSNGPEFLLTKRSSSLKHHPGQVAFPGGKVEASDAGPEDAAIREAEEETGLPRDLVEPLGLLPGHETVSSFTMTPVVAWIDGSFSLRIDPGEVQEAFWVPLAHVTNPENYRVEGRRWRGQRRLYFTVPFGPYYIWGATARMLRQFADVVR